jgi:hypothetical protein
LLNLMLMRSHYPPALLLRGWRIGYLQALAHADTGNYTPLANLIGRAVKLDWIYTWKPALRNQRRRIIRSRNSSV